MSIQERVLTNWRQAAFPCIALALGLFFLCCNAGAQIDQGGITGVVQDSSQAAIPNAQVTLTNTDTGLVQKTNADGSGIYSFSPIKIGNYKLTAASSGFQATIQEHIHVDAQARVNVPLTLQPGASSETITVSATPPALQTQSGAVGQVLTTQEINNIPLNGRNAVYVAQLAAGVTQGTGSRATGSGDFSANGQRPEENNFILDGIDNNTAVPDFLNGASYVVNPPPDALAEFNVQTSDYSAELGHSAGAVLNAATKSGTNEIHGDLWEYLRNTFLDARNFNALTVPTYHENQFGATLGAPVIKNKLFFFGYTEANRVVFGETYTESIPTALMRTGDFSELLNPSLTQNGVATILYQPGSAGTVLQTCNGRQNVICSTSRNTAAVNLLNLFPMPNANGGKVYNNYTTTQNAQSNSFQWGTRLDWNLSQKDQTFARFSYLNVPGTYPEPLGPILDGGTYEADGTVIDRGENFAFSETHVFTPNLVNEARLGFNYGNFGFKQVEFNNTNLAASLGLGGVPAGILGGGLPLITVTGLSAIGPPGFYPNHKNEDVLELLDNLTRVLGNHTVKVGVLFQNVRFPFFSPPNARGAYTYTGYFSSNPGVANTGFGTADFLEDESYSASIPTYQHLDFSHWTRSAYFQDDWRATKNLTVNVGLRYDYNQPLKEVSGKFANFTMQTLGPADSTGTLTYTNAQRSATLAPVFTNLLAANNVAIQYTGQSSLVTTQKLNFSPRLGFAYTIDDKTVFRGGYGIFFGGVENIGGPETLQNYPFQFTSNFSRGSTCVPGNCLSDGISLSSGFASYIAAGLTNRISQPSFTGSQPAIKNPYTEGYNVAIQRAFPYSILATVSYVGDVSRHLIVNINENSPEALIDPRLSSVTVDPFPAFGSIGTNVYESESNYNALQTKVERRFSNGLNFLATYTYAHSLDDSIQPLESTVYRGVNLIGIGNDYANSEFDVRHRVTLNVFYALPFGRGKMYLSKGRLLDLAVGGWQSDLQFTAQTGTPFTVTTDLGSAGPNGGTANAVLLRNPFAPGGSPDPSNPSISCATSTRNKMHWYNPCAFGNPPLAFPNAAVAGSPVSTNRITGLAALPYLGASNYQIYGPGYNRVNISLFKNFATVDEEYLQLRADVFNVANTPAYGNPSTTTNGSSGGQITAPQSFQNFTPDARFFQISAKYVF